MHANEFQKQALEDFWFRFGGKAANGRGFSKDEKVRALRWLAELVIPYRKQKTVAERRHDFNESKGVLHKMNIARNSTCFVCGGPRSARHHIIQLQNGGLNSRKNLISICDECHALIHPWLSKPAFH